MINIEKHYDVVVIGGGMSGVCAAIAAARHGAKTALVQNRPVLGGNASSEIRMHICGADHHANRPNARETGILEEILLKNKYRNPNYSYAIFDSVLWESCRFEPNLELYLNTHMDDAKTENNKIISISAVEQTSEKRFNFSADIFVDATGDGMLGALAGAEFMYGREDKNEFNEPHGQIESDNYTMGNSLMFQARDLGHSVKFIKPFWAYTYTEQDLKFRNHSDVTSGYWWIELGGRDLHTINDAELLRDELLKTVYGVWDHIKNGGDHKAENYELEWVGMLPGKRESRRLKGNYVLNENDLMSGRRFDDAIAYGGWAMDCHVIEGFKTSGAEPTQYYFLPDVYTIPYRCLVSESISNLMLGGRAFSTSHMAFSSTRVMATCAVVGQAIGTAAADAVKYGIAPSDIYNRIGELQQQLLKDDCYIPGIKNNDENDIARHSTVSASSQRKGYECENIINGVSRTVLDETNCYASNGISDDGEFVELKLDKQYDVNEVNIKFDSNLSKEIMISINNWVKSHQDEGAPLSLVKDYDVVFYNGETEVEHISKTDNFQRFNVIKLDSSVKCDKIRIYIYSTNGCENARIFEVRVY